MTEPGKKRKTPVVKEVAASDFKNGWYDYLDLVNQAHEEIVITRYGKPIAKVVPYSDDTPTTGIFGYLAGTVTICGDIIGPIDEAWDADA